MTERLFARVKQMNGIDNNKSWSKHTPWKQPNYDRNKKISQRFVKAESYLHVASRG